MIREELAQYGGIAIMIPAAVVIAVWLWYSRPTGGQVVADDNCLHLFHRRVQQAVVQRVGACRSSAAILLSGHAMNASLMVPVAISLVARRINPDWRWPAAVCGLLITAWFSAFCVAPYIHPLSRRWR